MRGSVNGAKQRLLAAIYYMGVSVCGSVCVCVVLYDRVCVLIM